MPKVLIVEDDPTLQSAYKTTLELEGYKTQVAGDGEEAWRLAEADKPDIILLDMMMPRVNGLQFLLRRQGDESLRKTRVIVFSNLGSPDDIDEALSLGASKYVTKSNFTPKEMIEAINEVLEAPGV